MSQQFYARLSSILFGFVVLLALLIANSEFLILYLLNPTNQAYYLGYLVLLSLSALFGFKYYREYRGFQETLAQGLLFPSEVNSFNPEPLDIPEDKALAVCTYYHNGATLTDIQRSMGFSHAQQVRRHLLKGLDILLREHQKREST